MSDIDITQRLRHPDLFSPLTDQNYQREVGNRAADEIERLRAEVAEKDRRIEDLMNHLKRVVAPVEVGGGTGGFHIITTEDIDKAWDGGRKPPTEYSDGFDAALRLIGIVACEKCGGSGEGDGSKDEYGYAKDCPYCDGHGWVVK